MRKSFDSLDSYHMRQAIRRGVSSSTLFEHLQNKRNPKTKTDEESIAETETDSFGDLGMHEGMSQEEIAAMQDCINYAVMLRKGGLTKEEKIRLEEGFKKSRQELQAIRQKYDSTGKPFSETVIRGNQIIRDIKSPTYIADKKKRKRIFKFWYYGIDDPFYDAFKGLYGDEGLIGYSKERLEAFKDIPHYNMNYYHEVVELASKRYKKVCTLLTSIKILAGFLGITAYFLKIFPKMVEEDGNPIMLAIGGFIIFFFFTEIFRTWKNGT